MSVLQTFMLWQRFEGQQWLSAERLRRLRRQKLREILHWALHTVPYYHGKFNGCFPERFSDVPILRKQDVQEHSKDLRSKKVPESAMTYGSTTGSTGIPLVIGHDAISRSAAHAAMLRALRAHGVRLTDTILRVTHRSRKQRWHERLGILPIRTLSVFDPPERLSRKAHAIRPEVIDGYPSVLQAMSSSIAPPKSLHHVFSTTEILTSRVRKKIQGSFGAPVVDLYGAAEFPSLAWECPSGAGYHIDSDYALVECLADGERAAPGEVGELVVTSLYGYGMPLIRYAIGDSAVMSEDRCPCGRGLPLLESIEGRTDDSILAPDGERVSPRRINVLDGISGVKQYRIVQTRKDKLVAEIVPLGAWTSELEEEVVRRIRMGLGPRKLRIEARPVARVPAHKGKIRTVVSDVNA